MITIQILLWVITCWLLFLPLNIYLNKDDIKELENEFENVFTSGFIRLVYITHLVTLGPIATYHAVKEIIVLKRIERDVVNIAKGIAKRQKEQTGEVDPEIQEFLDNHNAN